MHTLESIQETPMEMSDAELVTSLDRLAVMDRALGSRIVAHLAEVDRRRLHVDYGYSSLFAYCTERLGFSADCAYKRIRAARATLHCPQILDHLDSGALSLSTVVAVAPHVDRPDGSELVNAACHQSRREVDRLIASKCLKADSPRGHLLRPMGNDAYRLEVTVTADFAAKLEQARSLDRHRNPSGDVAALLERGLKLLIADLEKKKFGKTDQPKQRGTGQTKTVPAQVRREVHERDGARCSFVGQDGHRCHSRDFLEFDHVVPRGKGGEHSAKNGRILCAVHNRRAAELEYGKEPIEHAKERAEQIKLTRSALRNLGFSAREAKQAALAAAAIVASGAPLQQFLRAALNKTPRSSPRARS
jgi:hypothetical protein